MGGDFVHLQGNGRTVAVGERMVVARRRNVELIAVLRDHAAGREEAEAHAEEDRKAKETIEIRNNAEVQAVYLGTETLETTP